MKNLCIIEKVLVNRTEERLVELKFETHLITVPNECIKLYVCLDIF